MSDDLVAELLELDGVEKVRIETTVTVTHRKRTTGETDESFHEIREPIVPTQTFESIAKRFGWRHHGTIDVMGDYRLRDRFTHSRIVTGDDDE